MERVSRAIDLNSDLGEGFGAWSMADDEAMLRLITSANIACGAHAGDAHIMRARAETAAALGVRIGAHIGYRDRAGFGRRALPWTVREIEDETLHQIGALSAAATAAGDRVRYVKPHGALYHRAAAHSEVAEAIATATAALDRSLTLVGPAESAIEQAARSVGLTFIAEGFADRRYVDSARLVDRLEPDALLQESAAIEQGVRLARGHSLTGVSGEFVVRAETICIHGDTPDSVAMARLLRGRLDALGVTVQPFT
jgi:5-oxoprolinase (ATP-hydrolysing) subunit A